MRAQTYRPRVQNGQVAKRRNRPRSAVARKTAVRAKDRRREANVLWMLVCVGAFVASGFVFGLRSQINAHQLGQAEAQLRSELEEVANRQRYEALVRQRALSPREIDRAARQAGLIQPKFSQQPVKARKESVNQRQPARPSQRR